MEFLRFLILALLIYHCFGQSDFEKAYAPSRQSTSPPDGVTDCRSTLFRLIGSTNAYLWVCRCMRGTRRVAFGRSTYIVPKSQERSVRKHRAFVRCQNEQRDRLEHICFNNRSQYEAAAEHAMRRCANAKYIDDDKSRRIPSPFDFQRGECFAEFVGVFSPTQTNGLWACVCRQKDVEVVSGRAQFSSEFAPDGDSAEEVRELEECSRSAAAQFQDVCVNAAGDFQLLALHILQACCKRARVSSDAKFQCDAFVPKDVDALKPKSLP